MSTILCHLTHGFNKPTFAMLKLPSVPREGETILVGKHGANELQSYVVKAVGYRGLDQNHAPSDDASESFVVLKVDEK